MVVDADGKLEGTDEAYFEPASELWPRAEPEYLGAELSFFSLLDASVSFETGFLGCRSPVADVAAEMGEAMYD